MRKNKGIRQMMAAALCAIMVMSGTPVAWAAQSAEEDPPAQQSRTMTLQEEANLMGGATTFVLKGLASGALSSIAGYGMDAALEEIFGSEADNVTAVFAEMKGEIGKVQTQLDTMSAQIASGELKRDLKDYGAFINRYAGMYDLLCAYQKTFANDPELTAQFLEDLYSAENENFKIDGNTLMNATIDLGKKLTTPYQGETYNVFGAFDKLDKYTNRWEHQGYKQRNEFRKTAIYTYAMFSATSQLACQGAIDSFTKKGSKYDRLIAEGFLQELKDNATAVNEMVERCSVIEHPELRIYRDIKTGTDLYCFKEEIEKSEMRSVQDEAWNTYISNTNELKNEKFIESLSRTTSYNRQEGENWFTLFSQQPSNTIYHKIYEDYGSKYTLFHIFFDNDKGDFFYYTPDGLPSTIYFSNNTYGWLDMDIPLLDKGVCTWGMTVSDGGEEPISKRIIMAWYGKKGNIDKNKIDYLTESFFSPIYYYGAVNQGKLMLPKEEAPEEPAYKIAGMADSYELPYAGAVVLSAEEKEGYTHQWYLDIGDENGYQELPGETGASYSLPSLTAAMNGYSYRCGLIPVSPRSAPDDSAGEEEWETYWEYVKENYLQTAPVTLHMTGQDVPSAITEHTVSSAQELEDALAKVSNGQWDTHTLRLVNDIEYKAPITLLNRSVTINTNGYRLTVDPAANSEPNICTMSSSPAIAAVYVADNGALTVSGDGLIIHAGSGVEYGLYVDTDGYVDAGSVVSEGGATAVTAVNYGRAFLSGSVSAQGEDSIGVQCTDGGTASIEGGVTVQGTRSFGVHTVSTNEYASQISIGGNVSVSGPDSRGIYLASNNATVEVKGSVSVIDGVSGIFAGGGRAIVGGNISAPKYALNLSDGAFAEVSGSVVAGDENAVALFTCGGTASVGGNVYSTGSGGIGVMAEEWELSDPPVGASVTVEGKVSASTPLYVGGLLAEESMNSTLFPKSGYRTYSDGTSAVWVGIHPTGNNRKPAEEPDNGESSEETPGAETWNNPFGDVNENDWFFDDVAFVNASGLMKGIGAEAFDPKGNALRGEIVMMLYRLEGEPDVNGDCPFEDVTSGSFYEKAIHWAEERNIVAGFDSVTFRPDGDVTREQLMVILYNYANYKGYDVTGNADLSGFADKSGISGYAVTALSWAKAIELVNGKGGGILDPGGNADRAQLAAIFHRFCDSMNLLQKTQ